MNTTVLSLDHLPLYRVRVTCGVHGCRLIDFGRRLFSARAEAATFAGIGDLVAIVEAYDRHTGQTLRVVG